MEVVFTANGSLVANLKGPWSSILYVDNVRGNDATAVRGNDNLPFQTIQAALNAAVTGDTVWLASQHFTVAASLTIPSTITYLCIRGSTTNPSNSGNSATQPSTTIGPGTLNVFDLTSASASLRLNLFYVQFVNASAGFYSIVADGSVADLHLMRIHINYCINANVNVRRILEIEYVASYGVSPCIFNGIGTAQLLLGSQISGAVTVAYDAATDPAIPTILRVTQSSSVGSSNTANIITLTGQASLFVDDTSFVNGIVGSGLLAPSGGAAPSVSCSGYIGFGNVDFASAGAQLPDTATGLIFSFIGTRFYGPGSGATGQPVRPATALKFKVAGAAVNPQTIDLSSTTTGPGCAITAGAGANITGRGASWPLATYSTPDATGSITPDHLSGLVDASAGGTQAFTWLQLGYGMTRIGAGISYPVILTSSAQGADAVVPNAGKLATGFSITSTPQAGNTSLNWRADFPT